MKKILAAFMALAMLFMLSSCKSKDEPLPEIIASFSRYENEEFVVFVQDLGGVYDELYDEDGLYVKLAKDAKIYDADGNEIKAEDLRNGQTIAVTYSGKLVKKHPKTIKVYEIKTIG